MEEVKEKVVLIKEKRIKEKITDPGELLKRSLLLLDLDTKTNIRFLINVRDGIQEGYPLGMRLDAAKKLLDKQLPNKESVDLLSTIITGIVKLPARSIPKEIEEIEDSAELIPEKVKAVGGAVEEGSFKILTDEEIARNEAKEKVAKLFAPKKIGRPKNPKKPRKKRRRKTKVKIATLEDSLTSAFSKDIEDENIVQIGDEIKVAVSRKLKKPVIEKTGV